MATNVGTNALSTLLENTHQSVIEFGLGKVEAILLADLEVHNEIVVQQYADLVEVSKDTQRVYGASGKGDFQEVDEPGVSRSQQPGIEPEVAFPLKKFEYTIGWTHAWFKRHSPADMAKSMVNAQTKHLLSMQNGVRDAIFKPTNRTVNDRWASKVDLSVKALLNADGDVIPNGTSGQTFDGSTHTHYTGNATLTTAALDALISNVLEHRDATQLKVAINRANIGAFSALTGFTPATDPRKIHSTSSDVARMATNTERIDNNFIGLYNQAEIWAYSWVFPNYCTAYEAGSSDKVLVQREDEFSTGLNLVAHLETHPLYSDIMEYMIGFGALNRNLAACLQFDNASYVDPT